MTKLRWEGTRSISGRLVAAIALIAILGAGGCTMPDQATSNHMTTGGSGTPPTYTVTYDGDGSVTGSTPIDSNSYLKGAVVTVLGNTGGLAKPGYSFAGWNTQASGSGASYTQGSTFAMGSANVTLYARWTTLPTYTVTYDGNGNTGGNAPIDTTHYLQGATVTVLGNNGNLVKTGYAFSGWNTAANGGGTSYAPGSVFSIGSANVTLSAQWVLITYTVTYNGNGNTGGSAPTDSTSYVPGATVRVLDNTGGLVKTGYAFSGWNLAANRSGTSYAPGNTFSMGSANVTLYAAWAPLIETVAGNGTNGYSGDEGPATSAEINNPYSVAVDTSGKIYIADGNNNMIRRVSPAGTITTVAGTGASGYSGDGGPATSAELYFPLGVALDRTNNVSIADYDNNCVREISPNGTITTMAGTGIHGYSGDGGPATSAQLWFPVGVASDAAGNMYIADYGNARIRRVSPDGTITTVAGNGTNGYSGDGGPATSAALNAPTAASVDAAGNLYVADSGNNRIRKVSAAGIITTVAGTGTAGFSGDGGAAASAALNTPSGVAVDGAGGFYVADTSNNRLRWVSSNGVITTVAGNGIAAYTGDGLPAASAELNSPTGVAVDKAGNIYVADRVNARIRKVSAP